MPTFSAATLAVLQRQVGHVTSRQLTDGGIGRTARRRLVSTGVLEQPFKSVYRVATARVTLEQRLIALSLAHPSGFITGATLGGYLGLRRMPRASKITLCIAHDSRIDIPPDVHVKQSTRISPFDVRTLPNSMRVASWPRLIFDLAAELTVVNLISVIDQVLTAGHCTLADLSGIATRLCHPARRGSDVFMRALMERGSRKPVDSHPELRVLHGLLARDVPVEPQHSDLQLPNGKRIRIDLAVPSVRWAVEIDVHPEHSQPAGIVSDKQRDRQLHLVDWQVERVTDADFADFERLLDELAALYRARVAALAA